MKRNHRPKGQILGTLWILVAATAGFNAGGGPLGATEARAERVHTRISGIDEADPAAKQTEHLIFLEDGTVVRLSEWHPEWLDPLWEARWSGREITLDLGPRRVIQGVEATTPGEIGRVDAGSRSGSAADSLRDLGDRSDWGRPGEFPQDYEPTILENDRHAAEIFGELNRGWRRRSQCYNRAHVWAYESKRSHGLDSMKAFLFFTAKYIREYDYGWWFHVAPYSMVRMGVAGAAEARVLDRTFMRRPVDLQTWTNYFVYPKPKCPVVTRYQDYSEHQYEAYCYLILVSMYYWQPRDIESVSAGVPPKTEFIPGEVSWAYRQGFR